MSVELIHEQAFAVRYSETDPGGYLRPTTFLDHLQDAAAAHAEQLGFGVAALRTRDLTWMLTRLHIEVERHAAPGETVRVRTWPATRAGLLTFRDFLADTPEGIRLGRATTSWVVIDLRRRRPVRLDDVLPPYPLRGVRAIEDPLPPLPALDPGPGAREQRFVVQRSDLDINHHVNNAVYVRWALDSVPADLAESLRPAAVEAAYRAEALAGDAVLVRTAPAPDRAADVVFLHQVLREADGKELARLRTRWTAGSPR